MFKSLLSLALLVLPINCFSQTVDVNSAYTDFSGGLNDQDSAQYLQVNESPDLLNVEIDNPVGALKQRNGYIEFGTTPSGNPAINLYEYIKANGSRYLIVADTATVWATSDGITFSTIVTGLTSTSLTYFATVRDDLWIVNKSTSVKTWDGTTLTHLDGVSDTPNVSKGQYIEFWKERVWIARTDTEPSTVYFSEIADTDGNILNPKTSTAAWTATNAFYINREDGSPIYGIKVYRDNLFVFKETGIFRIIFESEFDAGITKAVSNIGCKFQDSIVEIDNYLYFVGNDGIYKFDGVNAQRISDKIQNRFNAIKQASISDKFKLWDSPTDWVNLGTLTNTSTSYQIGSVALDSDISPRIFDTFSDIAGWTFGAGTNKFQIDSGTLAFYSTAGGNSQEGTIYSATTTANWGEWGIDIYAQLRFPGTGGGTVGGDVEYYFVSDTTTVTSMNGYSLRINCANQSYVYPVTCTSSVNKFINGSRSVVVSSTSYFTGGSSAFTYYRNCENTRIIVSETGIINVTDDNGACALSATLPDFVKTSSKYNVIRAYWDRSALYANAMAVARIDNISIPGSFYTSGNYTSVINNIPAVSAWSTFDIDNTLNGQTITYSIRYASSTANVNAKGWSSITPGSIIQASTDTYIQWKADFATGDVGVTPLLNSAIINWSEGGVVQSRLFAFPYKNHMWLGASTTTTNAYNDMTFVKSKSPLETWAIYNIPLASMAKLNNVFLGGIANTGKIVRLDYGNKDISTAINSYWTSRDEIYGYPIYYKKINEAVLDYEKGVNTALTVSASPDNGDTYTNRTIDMTSGQYRRQTKRLNYDLFDSPNVRFKISNSLLDFGFTVWGLHSFGKGYKYSGR